MSQHVNDIPDRHYCGKVRQFTIYAVCSVSRTVKRKGGEFTSGMDSSSDVTGEERCAWPGSSSYDPLMAFTCRSEG